MLIDLWITACIATAYQGGTSMRDCTDTKVGTYAIAEKTDEECAHVAFFALRNWKPDEEFDPTRYYRVWCVDTRSVAKM